MTMDFPAVIAGLAAILGPEGVIGEPGRMGAYLNEPRKRYHTPAAAVARPRTVAEVRQDTLYNYHWGFNPFL